MNIYPGEPINVNHGSRPWVLYGVYAILGLVGLATLVCLAAAVIMLVSSGDDLDDPEEWTPWMVAMTIVVPLVLGLGACSLMLGTIIVHRHLARLSGQITAVDQQTAVMAEQSVARTQAHTYAADNGTIGNAEMKTLLEGIHDTLLLPDDERRKRFEQMMDREFRERLASTQRFIDQYDFARAREELATLVDRFGADSRVEVMQERLDKASRAAAADDIIRVTRHIEELMASGGWSDAERAVRELAQRYPEAKEPDQLLKRVGHERTQFEHQNRQRMHEEIQQAVTDRRWQQALVAARQFVQTFASGPDTDALNAQMETLVANADIQARQGLERRIKQYIQKQQYWDAVALARRIITEHPLSPQANALRGQVARLEELARAQGPHG